MTEQPTTPIRTVWTYKVNGEQMGTYDEAYCRGMFDTLTDLNPSSRIQVVRIDHHASDFATTGKNWDAVHVVVADSQPEEITVEEAAANKLLDAVYMPHGSLIDYGFNGGGPASPKQKNYLRILLRKHAGNPTAEAIRAFMNALARDEETTIAVSDVSPAISYLKTL